jgi:putative protease
MEEAEIGEITHFFSKIGVGVIRLTRELSVGYQIHVKGATTDFEQDVSSMQIDHKNIENAKQGDDIGMKFIEQVRAADKVYLVNE